MDGKKMNGQFYNNRLYLIPYKDFQTIIYDIDGNRISVSSERVSALKLKEAEDFIELQKPVKRDIPQTIRQEINYVIVGVAEACNLCCTYCYAEHGTYGQKEQKIMSLEELISMYERILKITPRGASGFCFFGGEPLLAFRQIQQFVEYVETFSEKKGLNIPQWSVVTNGTLISQPIVDFFNKHRFIVNVSLDGPKQINDLSRMYKNSDKSVFETVANNLREINSRRFLLCCQSTLGAEFFRHYHKGAYSGYIKEMFSLGYDFVAPLIAQCDDTANMTIKLQEKIRIFYTDMIDYDFECLVKGRLLEHVSAFTLTIIDRLVKNEYYLSCKAGAESIYYSAQGNFYRCHLYYEMGEKPIDEKVLQKSHNRIPYEDKTTHPDCQKCLARNICFSWCPAVDKLLNDKHDLASCYAQIFSMEYIIRRLVELQENAKEYSCFIESYKKAAERSASSNQWYIV